MSDALTHPRPVLRFGALAARSLAVTAARIGLGTLVCAWQTGHAQLSAAAVGAVAALTPLLVAGWLVTVLAMHRDLIAAGRAFVSVRLAALRFGMALVLLQCGRMLLAPRGASLAMWFAALYVVLLAVEAAWLADGARRIGDASEGSP